MKLPLEYASMTRRYLATHVSQHSSRLGVFERKTCGSDLVSWASSRTFSEILLCLVLLLNWMVRNAFRAELLVLGYDGAQLGCQ